ncbi:hypothetical protein ACOJVU_19775, partial [Mycobacterium sp. THU-M104]|uniref:hypothetical protein n=1 Tax=Mycobacterium sp. THU-M104 TaxID=3410515 RepID=UPI003B9AEFD4
TPDGIAQEIYALLTTYQALRIAMSDATTTRTADRAGFSIALNTACGQVIQAAGVIADTTTIDVIGKIGHAVLDHSSRSAATEPVPGSSNAPSPNTAPKDPSTATATTSPSTSASTTS